MFFVLLNILFNGFILAIALTAGSSLLWHKLPNWEYFLISYLIVGGLAAFGLTKPGQWLLRLFIGGRKAVNRERQIIEPILQGVIGDVNRHKSTHYDIKNMTILIQDKKTPNAEAFGENTIVLTDGLLRNSTEDELRAVIAHEMAHLYHKVSVMLSAIVLGNIATRIIMWLYAVYVAIATVLTAIAKGPLALMQLFIWLIALMFLPIIILNWLGGKVLQTTLMAYGRHTEYRADKFAVELGYRTGMVSFLERIHAMTENDNSFMGKIMATHPAPMIRIGKLEEAVA